MLKDWLLFSGQLLPVYRNISLVVKARLGSLRPYYTMLCFPRVFPRVCYTNIKNTRKNARKMQEKREKKHKKITQCKPNARTFFYITIHIG